MNITINQYNYRFKNIYNSIINNFYLYLHNFSRFFSIIISIYFSSFPQLLYNESNNYGNLAFAGIGLGLIKCQRIFWIYNVFMFTCTYFLIYYENEINYNLFFLFYLFILYLIFRKTLYLISFLEIVK